MSDRCRKAELFWVIFLPVIEQQLLANTYIAGESMTLSDINLLANLDPAELSDIDLGVYSKLSDWRSGLKQQAFYQKCFNDYSDVIKALAG